MPGDQTGIRPQAEPEPTPCHARTGSAPPAKAHPGGGRRPDWRHEREQLAVRAFPPGELFTPVDPCLPPSLI